MSVATAKAPVLKWLVEKQIVLERKDAGADVFVWLLPTDDGAWFSSSGISIPSRLRSLGLQSKRASISPASAKRHATQDAATVAALDDALLWLSTDGGRAKGKAADLVAKLYPEIVRVRNRLGGAEPERLVDVLCEACGASGEEMIAAARGQSSSAKAVEPLGQSQGRKEIHQLEIRSIPLIWIKVGKRFRDVDETKARKLAEDIREKGRLLQEIGLTRDLCLVWGAHRLRAVQILGWEVIPAKILPYSSVDPQAKIDELDENLQRNELTSLQMAQALAARKVAYEIAHPMTRRGSKGGRPAKRGQTQPIASPAVEATLDAANGGVGPAGKLTDTVAVSFSGEPSKPIAKARSFAADAAAKTGKSERTIRRATKIGKAIVPDVAAAVAKTPIAKQPKELAKLAKLDPEMQRTVAAMLRDGEAASVTEALAEPDPQPEEEPEVQASGVLRQLCEKLGRDWRSKCGKSATPQLGAAVLESVAAEWIEQHWSYQADAPRRKGKPR